MRTSLFALILLCALHLGTARAQQSNIGFGAELNFPSGNSSNRSAVGTGGFVKAELGLSNKFSLTASGGISHFFGRKLFGAKASAFNHIPVKGGFKYYTDENFYLEAQLGAAIPLTDGANTAFAWAPGIGTYIKTRGSENKIDIGLRYEGWSSPGTIGNSKIATFSFIGIRVGYVFGL